MKRFNNLKSFLFVYILYFLHFVFVIVSIMCFPYVNSYVLYDFFSLSTFVLTMTILLLITNFKQTSFIMLVILPFCMVLSIYSYIGNFLSLVVVNNLFCAIADIVLSIALYLSCLILRTGHIHRLKEGNNL